jgi:hypothetical protein
MSNKPLAELEAFGCWSLKAGVVAIRQSLGSARFVIAGVHNGGLTEMANGVSQGSQSCTQNFSLPARLTIGAIAILAVLLPSGCGGGSGSNTSNTPTSPTITTVTLTCSPSSITIAQSSTCTPTVTGTGGYTSSVTWSVSPSNIGAITSGGVFTPAAAGTATITATSTQDSTKSGTGSITATNTTALVISIDDLPAGTAGAVTLTDPNGCTRRSKNRPRSGA